MVARGRESYAQILLEFLQINSAAVNMFFDHLGGDVARSDYSVLGGQPEFKLKPLFSWRKVKKFVCESW
jgi:hypothetical protein